MADPVWVTTPGDIGTYPSLLPMEFQFNAYPVNPATSLTFFIINGSLPVGLTLSTSGKISGVPALSISKTSYRIVVRAQDNLFNKKDRVFNLVVSAANTLQFVTQPGLIANYPALLPIEFQIEAFSVLVPSTITYSITSGSLPPGLSMDSEGLISGTPEVSISQIPYEFVVRITDIGSNFRERTFSIGVSNSLIPTFDTLSGSILNTNDSVWVEIQIDYTNPVPNDPVFIRVIQGQLPPGLEINETGLIRGYPQPPKTEINLEQIITSISATYETESVIECISTDEFRVGRPIKFISGTPFGGLELGRTYYVHSVIDNTKFTISYAIGESAILLNNGTGYMVAELPNVSAGQPILKTFSFTLKIENSIGSNLQSYSITVINQNLSIAMGGPGLPNPTPRNPTILNTRPLTYNLTENIDYYGYYVLPNKINDITYPPQQQAYIGEIESDNIFLFKILGHSFSNGTLNYIFSGLPTELEGDPVTGWVTGTMIIADNYVDEFSFSVKVQETSQPEKQSPVFNFKFKVYNDVKGNIVWITDSAIGTIFNGTLCEKNILAISDVDLKYRIVSGSLPPNLTLLSNGQITGTTAYQPLNVFQTANQSAEFEFVVEAYSETIDVVTSTKTFALIVYQEYTQPTDTLYIRCTPDVQDRRLLESLLDNETLIPTDYLYRAEDPNFGKATSVVYAHAYGIHASNFEEYIAAVQKNHYWKSIVLGELSTAVARDENGTIIYEVVYSKVIDNLVNLKTPPQSVSKEVVWPFRVNLFKGPWYTSVTEIYTSYETYQGTFAFYTSLSPGYAKLFYPNSLPNMREQVADVLGQNLDFDLLPSWMTSQQLDGSTLGYIPAWVICYTQPGYSQFVKYNIENLWVNELGQLNTLNLINLQFDRFTVDKSITYNYDNNFTPPAWTQLPSATPTPDPLDSKNFYVLFPTETILPNNSQY